MYNTPYFVLYTAGLASSAWRRRWRRAAAVTASGAAAQVRGASALHGTPAASRARGRGRCGCKQGALGRGSHAPRCPLVVERLHLRRRRRRLG